MKFVILAIFLLGSFAADSDKWGYTAHGSDWTGTCKTGTAQSPIAITEKVFTPWASGKKFNVEFDYDIIKTKNDIKLADTGHYLMASIKDHGKIKVTGLMKDDTQLEFELINFHIHFGSEHTVGGTRYDGEMHFVHKLVTKSDHPQTHFVLGIYFKNDGGEDNSLLTALNPKSLEAIKELDLNKVFTSLPKKGAVLYDGSLTTPTCDEVVTFLLFNEAQSTNAKQLVEFTKQHNNNYRHIQKLNERKVYSISKVGMEDLKSFSITPLPLLAAILAFLFILF